MFQMHLDGHPVAETMPTPQEAVDAGHWTDIPTRVWGWLDIKRELLGNL